jgi:hypothetical protein
MTTGTGSSIAGWQPTYPESRLGAAAVDGFQNPKDLADQMARLRHRAAPERLSLRRSWEKAT